MALKQSSLQCILPCLVATFSFFLKSSGFGILEITTFTLTRFSSPEIHLLNLLLVLAPPFAKSAQFLHSIHV